MKSIELAKLILRNGWKAVRRGVHYTASFHGSKEVGKGLEMKIKKEMGLK